MKLAVVGALLFILCQISFAADIDDNFSGNMLDTMKWENQKKPNSDEFKLFVNNGLTIETTNHSRKIKTKYMIDGDFSVQVRFKSGIGWESPVPSSGQVDFATLGVFLNNNDYATISLIEDQNYWHKRRIQSFYFINDNCTCLENVCYGNPIEGYFKIERKGYLLSFYYNISNEWIPTNTIFFPIAPVKISLELTVNSIEKRYSTVYQDFKVNYGNIKY
jgi:hypothetical protein